MASRLHTQAETPELARLVDALRKARDVLVITGAGISAESDIPTFRGEGGWWRSQNPEDLATFAAFKKDPRFVWQWYEYRRGLVAAALPNPAHKAIARLEAPNRNVFIITQNVDDLHERAGSHRIVHIHGSIWKVICLKDNKVYEDRRVPLPELPPLCECGGILRPGVVWFDEELPSEACAQIADYFRQTKVDVVLVVGTEATFDYIREWALRAHRAGALLVEINPGETVLTPQVDVRLQGKAGNVLKQIQDMLSLESKGP